MNFYGFDKTDIKPQCKDAKRMKREKEEKEKKVKCLLENPDNACWKIQIILQPG
jgi:hypothetical protein